MNCKNRLILSNTFVADNLISQPHKSSLALDDSSAAKSIEVYSTSPISGHDASGNVHQTLKTSSKKGGNPEEDFRGRAAHPTFQLRDRKKLDTRKANMRKGSQEEEEEQEDPLYDEDE